MGSIVSTEMDVRVRCRRSASVPDSTVRPALMMLTRSPSASTPRRDVAGQQDGSPSGPPLATVLEHRLHERVEPGCRFVEQVELDVGGRMPQRAQPSAGCPWSRYSTSWWDRARSARVVVAAPPVESTTQRTEQVNRLATGKVGPQAHLPWHVRQALVHRGVPPRVAAEAHLAGVERSRPSSTRWSTSRSRSGQESREPRPSRPRDRGRPARPARTS